MSWGRALVPWASGDMINSFLHPEDAYKEAEKASNASWDEQQGYGRPYWQQGIDQYGRLNSAENDLLDPGALQNKWGASYETSPYAKRLLEMNKNSGLDAASSMGLMGSSAALGNIQTGAGDIVAKDRQNFMNDLMQKYLAGIGIGQNIYGVGANTAGNLMTGAQQHGQDVAGLRYGAAAAPGQLFGNILGTAASAGANYATGGMSGVAQGLNNRFNSPTH